MKYQMVLRAALMTAVIALAQPALAHGTKKHADAKPVAAEDAEQMPWGIAGVADNVQRTVEVRMLDKMRFEPSTLQVALGETVRFKVENTGSLLHEFVLGTEKTNDEHAALMVRFPGMEHDEPYMAHVDPGKTGEIIWTFNRPGQFHFACLIAGHYQAGMTGSIVVSPK